MARKNRSPDEVEKGGLSQGAWVAIGTLGAALISGLIALLIHLLPATPPPAQSITSPTSSPISSTSVPPATAAPSPSPVAANADAIAGKWSGTAKTGEGISFQITLEVKKSCALSQRCGSISVSHVPCEGEIFLEKIQDNVFEFNVSNFFGRSNRDVCQPGAGELFRLRSDGKLSYTTTYEPGTEGVLERTGE